MGVEGVGAPIHKPQRVDGGGELGGFLGVGAIHGVELKSTKLCAVASEGEAGHRHVAAIHVLVKGQRLPRAVDLEKGDVVLLPCALFSDQGEFGKHGWQWRLCPELLLVGELLAKGDGARLLGLVHLLASLVGDVVHDRLLDELEDAVVEVTSLGVVAEDGSAVGEEVGGVCWLQNI